MAFNVTLHGRPVTRSVMLAWSRTSEPGFADNFRLQLALQVCTEDLRAADWVAGCISTYVATDDNGSNTRAVLLVQGGSSLGWSMPHGHVLFDVTGERSVIWSGQGVGSAYFAVLPAAPIVAG